MGSRPLSAGRLGYGAHSRSQESRRPVLRGQVPGHAPRRLHAAIRKHARTSKHHPSARNGVSRRRSRAAGRADRSTRARSTSSSTSVTAGCPIVRFASNTALWRSPATSRSPSSTIPTIGRTRELPNTNISPDSTIQRRASRSSIHKTKAIRTIRFPVPKMRRCTPNIKPRPTRAPAFTSSDVLRRTSTTIWIRSLVKPWQHIGGCMESARAIKSLSIMGRRGSIGGSNRRHLCRPSAGDWTSRSS